MLQGNENHLIITWHIGAKCITTENSFTKKQKIESIKLLAQQQLNLLENTKPNKNKPLKDQLNKEQKELIEYLENVIETGEY